MNTKNKQRYNQIISNTKVFASGSIVMAEIDGNTWHLAKCFDPLGRAIPDYQDSEEAAFHARRIALGLNILQKAEKAIPWLWNIMGEETDGGKSWCAIRDKDGATEFQEQLKFIFEAIQQSNSPK